MSIEYPTARSVAYDPTRTIIPIGELLQKLWLEHWVRHRTGTYPEYSEEQPPADRHLPPRNDEHSARSSPDHTCR